MHRCGGDSIHTIHRWKFGFNVDSGAPGENLSTGRLWVRRGRPTVKQPIVETFEWAVDRLKSPSHCPVGSNDRTAQVKQ
jgi:hypothetical protein